MNILIESGATKSTCIGYDYSCTFFVDKTTGINATYATKGEIITTFQDIIIKNKISENEVENIRFYGAGCYNVTHAEKVKEVLSNLFPKSNIAVFSDLFAACHALCKNNSGFVGILGTGASSCFYDGTKIVKKATSLGWLLGDEGSGVYLGKLFIKEYLTDKIEIKIAQDFENFFSVSKQMVLHKIYQDPQPQTFFASIPVFLQKHIDNKQIKTYVESSFQEFFNKQKEYYLDIQYPWFFCGSIAYYFQDILTEIAGKNNLTIEKIISECAPYLLHF